MEKVFVSKSGKDGESLNTATGPRVWKHIQATADISSQRFMQCRFSP